MIDQSAQVVAGSLSALVLVMQFYIVYLIWTTKPVGRFIDD